MTHQHGNSHGEFRRDHDLPAVNDTDPDRTEKLANLLVQFASDKIPGIGIIHEQRSRSTSQEDMHNDHQLLIKDALSTLLPKITTTGRFIVIATESPFRNTDIHVDTYFLPPLKAAWRLHTADRNTGALVRLVSTSGKIDISDSTLGLSDSDLYGNNLYPTEEAVCQFGYDDSLKRHSSRTVFEDIADGSYDPLVTQPDVYQFRQLPLSSVLFKAGSTLGNASAHQFTTLNGRRNITVSDLIIETSSV